MQSGVKFGPFQRGLQRALQAAADGSGTFISSPSFQVSWFRDGVRTGVSWEFKAGGGAVVGTVDVGGDLSGMDINYMYPDMWTMIIGQYNDGVLVKGYESRVEMVKMVDGIADPLPMTPKKTNVPFTFEESNKTHITATAGSRHLRDPYEEQYIEVRISSLPKAGRGLFLKRPVEAGTIIGFYNGVRMSNFESKIRKADRTSSYRIDNDWAVANQVLNIPENLREPYMYNATLAHFSNHGEKPNSWFGMIDHPRFGAIRSLVAQNDLKTGTEIFCDYGFIQEKMAADSMFDTVLDVGQAISGKTGGEFHHEIKHTVKYLKDKVDEYKPYLNMLKMGMGVKAANDGGDDGGSGGGGGGNNFGPVLDVLKMGMGAMAGNAAGGGRDASGEGGNDLSPMMNMVKMGMGAMAAGKSGSKDGGDLSPMMNMVKMGMGSMAGDSGSKGGGDLSPMMNMVKMGMGAMAGDSGSKGGGELSPMMNMVKMGMGAMAGDSGAKGGGGDKVMKMVKMGMGLKDAVDKGSNGDYKPVMDMVKMGMKTFMNRN
jgi:hypothetical protein